MRHGCEPCQLPCCHPILSLVRYGLLSSCGLAFHHSPYPVLSQRLLIFSQPASQGYIFFALMQMRRAI